jgi:hypothetical protein
MLKWVKVFGGSGQCLPEFSLISLFRFKVACLQISRHGRQSHDQPIEFLGHDHLATQARGLGKAKGQIQHVILVV